MLKEDVASDVQAQRGWVMSGLLYLEGLCQPDHLHHLEGLSNELAFASDKPFVSSKSSWQRRFQDANVREIVAELHCLH